MKEEKLLLGKCELFLDKTPENGKFDRVHAILVTPDGRVLLRYKNGEPRVTGGRIDAEDKDLVAALSREVMEEINCKIDKSDYLGYIEAELSSATDNSVKVKENFARMVARISEIGEPKPDPDRDGNWIYKRALVPPEIAKAELGDVPKFGENNLRVLEAAYEIAAKQGYFTADLSSDKEILNPESRDD